MDGRFGAGNIVRERERYRKELSDAFPFQSLTHMSSPFQGGLGLGRMGASTPFARSGLDPNDKKAGLYAHFVPAGATGHHHFDPASGESTSGIPASEAKGETAKAKKQKKKKKKKKEKKDAEGLTNDAAADKPKKRKHSTEGATQTENPQKRKKTEGGVAVVELEPDSSIADERKKKKKNKKKQEDENKLEETTSCNADGLSKKKKKKKEEEEKKEKKEKKGERETETPIAVMADDVAQKLAKCKKRIAKTSDEAELSRLRIKLAKLETKARS